MQLDVKSAFLHGEINREKYVSIPQGIDIDPKKFVCKLNKALYGLAVSSKCWNDTFSSHIVSCGFQQSLREPCLYTKHENGLITLVLIYVDDILVSGNDQNGIRKVCQILKTKFQMKRIGISEKILGF